MKILIDANLPPLSPALCQDLGIRDARKITADLSDPQIYSFAKSEGYDLILTRDSDFEPIIERVQRHKPDRTSGMSVRDHKNSLRDYFNQHPKVIFFKRGGMTPEELEGFMRQSWPAIKTFVALQNPEGVFQLHYMTVADSQFTSIINPVDNQSAIRPPRRG